MRERSQRALLVLHTLVPYPFMLLGIPFITAAVEYCFRATCICFSLSSAIALASTEYHEIGCRSALFWHGLSCCVVSYAWCASCLLFVAFQIAVNAFQFLSVTFLLEKQWRNWHVASTCLGSIGAFVLGDMETAAPDAMVIGRYLYANVTNSFTTGDVDKKQKDDAAVHWAIVLITSVLCLVAGMCAIGYCTVLCYLPQRRDRRVVERHERDFNHLMPDVAVVGAPTGVAPVVYQIQIVLPPRGVDSLPVGM